MGAIGAGVMAASVVLAVLALTIGSAKAAVECYEEAWRDIKCRRYKSAVTELVHGLFFSAMFGLIVGGCAISYEVFTTTPTKQEASCSK